MKNRVQRLSITDAAIDFCLKEGILKNNILLVEDEQDLREFLSSVFEENGYSVLAFDTGAKALEAMNSFQANIVILDYNLPDLNGFQILQKMKEHPNYKNLPVIFLTAATQEESIINAFDLGADDYIEKPFSTSVLLRRIKAVLKRSDEGAREKSISVLKRGDLEVDFDTYKVKIAEKPLEMTLMEFNILKELIKAEGRPLSREALINRINGSTSVTERTVDVHICSIRKKLNDFGKTIETIRGVGYRLQV